MSLNNEAATLIVVHTYDGREIQLKRRRGHWEIDVYGYNENGNPVLLQNYDMYNDEVARFLARATQSV